MDKTLAQITNPVLPGAIGSGGPAQGAVAFGNLIASLLGIFMLAAFVLSFIFLVLGGAQWILSGGDKTQLETARNKIINALLGLIIVASAWAIMTLVSNFLGLGFPSLPIPTLLDGGRVNTGGSLRGR